MRILIISLAVLFSCSIAAAQQPLFSRLTPSSCPNGSCSTASAPVVQALAQIPEAVGQVVQLPRIALQNAVQPLAQFRVQPQQVVQPRRVLFPRLRAWLE